MWSQVLDRNSRRGMSALDSAQVIRCRNTLPKWTADTSKISSQNPIIHRASPILQLAHWRDIPPARARHFTGGALNKEQEIVMSTNSSPPTRRSVLKIAAAGGALGLVTSASSSIVNPARAAGIAADNAA